MLSSGTRIGAYEIEHEIGRGGMGVVYRAIDTRLGRAVAIKALPEDLGGNADRLTRFEREARTLASLSHANVGAIYGVEEQGGHRYLVLELVEGETLDERIDRGGVSVEEALDICAQIAAGVGAAHDEGVVHRDLKPSNVKITPDGRVKVLDFGLAKGGGGVSSSLSESPTLTTPVGGVSPTIPGAIMGTAAYMSPEQARGRAVDRRTDVWALGVILYECLTGFGPFAGETATDSIGAVLHKEVEMDRLPAGTPSGARLVLTRCLERDKAKRWRDMGDVRVELERARGAGAEDALSAGGGRGRAIGVLGMIGWVIALAAVIGAVALQAGRGAGAPGVVRTSVVAPEGIAFTWVEISPDGSRLAAIGRVLKGESAHATFARSVYVRDLSRAKWRLVEGSGGAQQIMFSPDGLSLAMLTTGEEVSSERRLLSVPSDLSARAVEVMRVPEAYRVNGSAWFTWTADGEIACLSRGTGELVVFEAGTGREVRRLAIDTGGEDVDYASFVGPFGRDHVALHTLGYSIDGYREDAVVISVRDGRYTSVVEDANSLRMTPGGDVLYTRGETIFWSAFDPVTLKPKGRARPVEDGLATGMSWEYGLFAFSGGGTLAYRPGGLQGASRSIVIVDDEGAETVWSDERRAFEDNIAVSANGRRLAVMVANRGGLYDVWVSEVDRRRLRRLFAEAGTDFYAPILTPDGEHVIVTRWNPHDEEGGELLVARFDGTDEPRRIVGGWTSADDVFPRSVSPDGERVLIDERLHSEPNRLVEIGLDDGDHRRVLAQSEGNYHTPAYAPEGTPLIAYVSEETGRPEAYVREISASGLGPAIPVTTRGAWRCGWSVDGAGRLWVRHLGLDRREFMTEIVYDERPVIGETRPIARPDRDYVNAHLMLDGRLMVIKRGEDEAPTTRVELVQGWLGSIEEGD